MHNVNSIVVVLALLCGSLMESFSQCNTTVLSTNGYAVNISLNPVSLIVPNTCVNGYNFNVEIDYEISFSGPNQPANIYFMNGNMACGSFTNNSFGLFTTPSMGTVQTSGNPFNPATDCATATVASLMCDNFSISLEGPGIPNQTVSCNVTVPIILSYFNVNQKEDESVLLQWATEKEIDNDFFTVERSKDAKVWEVVEKISGGGDSDSRLLYRYIDNDPRNGISYYRLKQTDYNGKYTYSPIRKIDIENRTVKLYPSPASDYITVSGSPKKFSIVSSSGDIVKQVIPSNTQTDVSDLPNGLYFLVSDLTAIKFIKISH